MKNHIKGLAHIGVYTNDINKSIDFYKKLGFALDREDTVPTEPPIRLAFLSAGTCLVELVEQHNPLQRNHGFVDHFAVVVDDIDAAVASANANGINIDANTIMDVDILGGVRNVFFTGPSGEKLEFFQYGGSKA